ncbi:hypothetical protein [Roseospira marina]|nr:hypothetical protein [Roseospira marina]
MTRTAATRMGALGLAIATGLAAAPPTPAHAQEAQSPGTERLMDQLRDLGLAPEQEGMDAQGLVDDSDRRGGLMDRYRQEREAREAARRAAEDPGEPLLAVPPTLMPNVREELRRVVQELSRYARSRDPGFAVLARNGTPLAFRAHREAVLEAAKAAAAGAGVTDPDSPAAGVGEPAAGFLGAVDGIVMDGQFCGEPPVSDEDLARLGSLNLVLISIDHCADLEVVAEARRRAAEAGVMIHADTDPNGRLDTVPEGHPYGENAENITDPHQARSVLVLNDARGYGESSRLIGALRDTNHDLLILNPFALGSVALGREDVAALRYKKLGARRMVLATFDVGMAHETAYYWSPGWSPGEPRWLQATARGRPGAQFTAFWDPAWKALLSTFFVAVMDLGYDGIVFEGLDSLHRWEAIMPLEQ